MAHGVFSMSPSMRRLASVFLAALLTLLVAGPAFGYNEENVKHIRVCAPGRDPVRRRRSVSSRT